MRILNYELQIARDNVAYVRLQAQHARLRI